MHSYIVFNPAKSEFIPVVCCCCICPVERRGCPSPFDFTKCLSDRSSALMWSSLTGALYQLLINLFLFSSWSITWYLWLINTFNLAGIQLPILQTSRSWSSPYFSGYRFRYVVLIHTFDKNQSSSSQRSTFPNYDSKTWILHFCT